VYYRSAAGTDEWARAREANRVQKILETANIKLGDVATDVLGVSGRAMIEGERDTARMADLAKRSLRKRRDALQEALNGRFTDHHGFLLRQVLRHVDFPGRADRRVRSTHRGTDAPFRQGD
jgi:transposase